MHLNSSVTHSSVITFLKNIFHESLLFHFIFALFILSSCSKNNVDKNNSPVITSVSPLEGPKDTRVTILGSNFGNNSSNTSVFFNDHKATILGIYNDKIICNVPVKAGSGAIKVVTSTNGTANGPLFTYKYTAIVTTLAGSINGYADGTGSAAKFGQSNGLCNDESGNVYMVDYFNSKVRKVTTGGVVTTVAGGDLGYADGTGSTALFSGPLGIVYAGNNNFYIADTYNHLIRKMSAGGVVSTIAGTPVSAGFADGNGTAAKFYNPAAICVDANGNLYVADALNHKIRKVTSNGNVTTLAGSSQGYQDGEGTNAKFNQPSGICVDAQGNVYVSEFNNHKIRKITPSGIVSTLAGSSPGTADGLGVAAQFYGPAGICIDKQGNIWVADSMNDRIRKVTPNGEVTTIIGAVTNEFARPSGVSIDSDGVLYVMDTYAYRIRKIIVD